MTAFKHRLHIGECRCIGKSKENAAKDINAMLKLI